LSPKWWHRADSAQPDRGSEHALQYLTVIFDNTM
jgi:hypothetical protein